MTVTLDEHCWNMVGTWLEHGSCMSCRLSEKIISYEFNENPCRRLGQETHGWTCMTPQIRTRYFVSGGIIKYVCCEKTMQTIGQMVSHSTINCTDKEKRKKGEKKKKRKKRRTHWFKHK